MRIWLPVTKCSLYNQTFRRGLRAPAMVYAMAVCKLFFTALLWPSCCMLLRLGANSRLLMTINELTHFYAGASDVVSVGKTYWCSRNCWTIVMNSYLTRLWTIRNMFCIACYRHLQQHHNTTNLGNERTTDNTPGA